MSYRAIYAYAWDIAERGVDAFVAEIRALGLDTVTLAGAYHAGKFIRPRGKAGKVYFPEDGTAYFRVDPARYDAIKPVLNSLVVVRDVLRELCEAGFASATGGAVRADGPARAAAVRKAGSSAASIVIWVKNTMSDGSCASWSISSNRSARSARSCSSRGMLCCRSASARSVRVTG